MNYENTLFEISDRVGTEEVEKYYVLAHKKHHRVICFKDSKEALEFIKPKFRHSFLKRCFHKLLTWGFHKWYCETINLSADLGDVIYMANSVKSFDLKKECAYVFEDDEEKMIDDVKLRIFLGENGFAPKVLAINPENLYYKEELLYNSELETKDIAAKLAQFHKFTEYQFIHGDFVKDHVKVDKQGNIKFIDWMIRPGNSNEDVKSFIERSQC